jgi:hypothetical protein
VTLVPFESVARTGLQLDIWSQFGYNCCKCQSGLELTTHVPDHMGSMWGGTGEIARAALKKGLIKCSGKTPEATMASALYTDIKRKELSSVFIRPREGLFGLREWETKGIKYKVCASCWFWGLFLCVY